MLLYGHLKHRLTLFHQVLSEHDVFPADSNVSRAKHPFHVSSPDVKGVASFSPGRRVRVVAVVHDKKL